MAGIRLESISKTYDNGVRAVQELSLDIEDREFLVLVGPSGCGKSTALRMIAGLEEITEGELFIGDRKVNEVEPKNRDLAMVFQNYALYPHMTVAENIAFPLKVTGVGKQERRERAAEAAALLELTDQLDKRPGQLSGGQRQRVAMGRAIVRQPAAFLMDEPLSNLDAKLRVQMRAEISQLQRRLGVTTVYVTHDQVEAMTMGDRVAVLKDGVLQQVGTPQELYDRPVNVFVASFIGSPAMNLYEGTLTDGRVTLGSHELRLPAATFEARPDLRRFEGRAVVVGVRPEDLDDASLPHDDRFSSTITCPVVLTERLGNEVVVHFAMDAPTVETDNPDLDPDVTVVHAVGRFDRRTAAVADQQLAIAVNTTALHFFDPDDGSAVWG